MNMASQEEFQKKVLESLKKNLMAVDLTDQPEEEIIEVADTQTFQAESYDFTAFGAPQAAGPTSGGNKDIVILPGAGGTQANSASQINFYWNSPTIPDTTGIGQSIRATLFNYATSATNPVLAIGGWNGTTNYLPSATYGGGSGTTAKIWFDPFLGRIETDYIGFNAGVADTNVAGVLFYDSSQSVFKGGVGAGVGKTIAFLDNIPSANSFFYWSDGTNIAQPDAAMDTFTFVAGVGITLLVNASGDSASFGATNIPNASLTNSSITVGSTAISLGASSTTIAGLTSLASTNISGTAITATTFFGFLSGTATSSQVINTTTDTTNTLYLLGSRSSTGFAGTAVFVDSSISILGNTITATTFSGNATTATSAGTAGTATNAGSAGTSVTAGSAGTSVTAGSAGTSVTAGSAGTAVNAGAAGKWLASRTVSFATGDVTGSFSIDGSANVSDVALTIGANSVALGTDTTGNYALSVATSGSGISTIGAAGEGTAFTIDSNATSSNTNSTLVFRDAAGLFAAAGATFGSVQIDLVDRTVTTSTGNLILDSTGGTVNVNDNLTISGNLTVQGTTTAVDSTVSTIVDPILSIGGSIGGTNPGTDDNKDRGIEFKYFSGTAKTGFFGFDDSTGFFTFIPDGTNASEVFSGTVGVIDATRITGSASSWTTARTVSFATGDVTGSFTIDGSANVSNVALTIAADSVALGTDTTGNYVSNVQASGSGISIIGSAAENATLTVNSNATATNTVSTLVFRDSSGNFSAGTITANLTGTASIASSAAAVNTVTDTSNTLYLLGSRSSTGIASTQVYVDSSISIVGNTITATTFSGNATTATSAGSAGTSVTAGSAGTSVSAGTAGTATNAGSAGTSVTAGSAGTATNAANTNITLDTTSTIYMTGSRSNASIGSTPVYVLSGVSALGNTVTATTFSGNATTATVAGQAGKWIASRTVTFATGDVTGSFSIDGSADVSNVALTIGANSVALGTDTTGDYVANVLAGSGIATTGAATGEGTVHTVSLKNAASLTNNTVPKWVSSSTQFADSAIVDDGTTVAVSRATTLTSSALSNGTYLTITTAAGDDSSTSDYFIRGLTSNATSKFSIDANGNLRATTKSFDIEHPTKPGMRLVYGVLEGPEHGVYHRGTVEGKGKIVVELPEYWHLLSGSNYSIQLTPWGNYNAHIVEKTENNFTIQLTGDPLTRLWKTIKVDYIIHGSRLDAPLVIEQK
jgi:hypothetical protein